MASSKRAPKKLKKPACDDRAYLRYVACTGPALQAIRKLQGRSQQWLGHQLTGLLSLEDELEQSYISQVERGKKGISMLRWMAWCQVLECDPEVVLRLTRSIVAEEAKAVDMGMAVDPSEIAANMASNLL